MNYSPVKAALKIEWDLASILTELSTELTETAGVAETIGPLESFVFMIFTELVKLGELLEELTLEVTIVGAGFVLVLAVLLDWELETALILELFFDDTIDNVEDIVGEDVEDWLNNDTGGSLEEGSDIEIEELFTLDWEVIVEHLLVLV